MPAGTVPGLFVPFPGRQRSLLIHAVIGFVCLVLKLLGLVIGTEPVNGYAADDNSRAERYQAIGNKRLLLLLEDLLNAFEPVLYLYLGTVLFFMMDFFFIALGITPPQHSIYKGF